MEYKPIHAHSDTLLVTASHAGSRGGDALLEAFVCHLFDVMCKDSEDKGCHILANKQTKGVDLSHLDQELLHVGQGHLLLHGLHHLLPCEQHYS